MRISKPPIGHIEKVLCEKATVLSRALFWRILHNSGKEDVHLKIGRYRKPPDWPFVEAPETMTPKSELTLDDEEFRKLIEFIQENYEPFRAGTKAFIPLDRPLDDHTAKTLKHLFSHPEKRRLIDFVAGHEIIPAHLILALHQKRRMEAIADFQCMLTQNLTEPHWQRWFQGSSWVLGTEFVRILDEREVDTQHICDFLMQAYDGFLDIVEIKRPGGGLHFWADKVDHGNYVPSQDLTRAITQASHYIYEVERQADSVKFLERVNRVKTIKPRCILIFGRSDQWNAEQCKSYRILNSSFHNLTVLSYDHVLDRAQRLLRHEDGQQEDRHDSAVAGDIPF
jgi:hypothetical protein